MSLTDKKLLSAISHFFEFQNPILINFNIEDLYFKILKRYESMNPDIEEKARKELQANGFIFLVNKTVFHLNDVEDDDLARCMAIVVYRKITSELYAISNCRIQKDAEYDTLMIATDKSNHYEVIKSVNKIISSYDISFIPEYTITE